MDAPAKLLAVDASGLAPDVVTVDALARLQLAARRAGRDVSLDGASADLLELIELCGLSAALVRGSPRDDDRPGGTDQ